jgi:hypothetical protein
MFWVLIYIDSNFLAPIPLISLGFIDFSLQFPPKLTNVSSRISRKSASRKKPAHRPAKASHRLKPAHRPAKAGPQFSCARSRSTASPRAPQLLSHHRQPPARPARQARQPPVQPSPSTPAYRSASPGRSLLAHAQQRARTPRPQQPQLCSPSARPHQLAPPHHSKHRGCCLCPAQRPAQRPARAPLDQLHAPNPPQATRTSPPPPTRSSSATHTG